MAGQVAEARRGRKITQVIDGARLVFLRDGFEGAGVDAIAQEAGVSKATLYSYFPDKRHLFAAVVKDEMRRLSDSALAEIDQDAPPPQVLNETARQIVEFQLSAAGVAIYRLVVAESSRFPEIGREYYKVGPKMLTEVLSLYLARASHRGEITVDDPDMAAWQFFELCQGDLFMRRVTGVQVEFSTTEIARLRNAAVETFLARYGT